MGAEKVVGVVLHVPVPEPVQQATGSPDAVQAPSGNAPHTWTVTVKLPPVTRNSAPISPLVVFAWGAAFVTATADPVPLVRVSTNFVFTAGFVPA